MTPVVSLADIMALFDQPHAPGKWFLVAEAELITSRKTQFAFKDGRRPVVFVKSQGPNSIVYPRSASGKDGHPHAAHTHLDPACTIKKAGTVLLHVPVTVKSSALSSQTFTCFEPQESSLMLPLRAGAR